MRCLLVDKILFIDSRKAIKGIKNVTMSEDFLADHFPGFPVMPGVLQIESCVQLFSWLVFSSTDFRKTSRLSSFKAVKFKGFIVPGEQMLVDIDVVSFNDEEAMFNAKIFVEGSLRTDIAECRASFTDLDKLTDHVKAKQHFDILCGIYPSRGQARL